MHQNTYIGSHYSESMFIFIYLILLITFLTYQDFIMLTNWFGVYDPPAIL